MNKEQKVFCIGLPRTGTTSLDLAFKELGVPAIHFPFEFWEKRDFSALEEYQAFSDTPVFAMYEELDRRCPNAKFILTTREVGGWLKSMEWLLSEGPRIWPWRVEYNDFNFDFFGSATFEKVLFEDAFFHHHKRVGEYFKNRPGDLLVLDQTRNYGFKELCSFLDLPCPDTPYPVGNAARKPSVVSRLHTCIYGLDPRLASIFKAVCRRIGHLHVR